MNVVLVRVKLWLICDKDARQRGTPTKGSLSKQYFVTSYEVMGVNKGDPVGDGVV